MISKFLKEKSKIEKYYHLLRSIRRKFFLHITPRLPTQQLIFSDIEIPLVAFQIMILSHYCLKYRAKMLFHDQHYVKLVVCYYTYLSYCTYCTYYTLEL